MTNRPTRAVQGLVFLLVIAWSAHAVAAGMRIRDGSLAKAFSTAIADKRISKGDVDKMLEAVRDGNGMTKTEKNELEWILFYQQSRFDKDARAKLCSWLGRRDGATVPRPGLYFEDRSLRAAFQAAMRDRKLTKSEVLALIESTKDGRGMSKTEKRELLAIYNRLPAVMDFSGRKQLAEALGLEPPDPPEPEEPDDETRDDGKD